MKKFHFMPNFGNLENKRLRFQKSASEIWAQKSEHAGSYSIVKISVCSSDTLVLVIRTLGPWNNFSFRMTILASDRDGLG